MPAELFTMDEFVDTAKRASKCFVKKRGNEVKLKLRTKSRLYTYKTTPAEAERLIGSLNIEVQEL